MQLKYRENWPIINVLKFDNRQVVEGQFPDNEAKG